MLKKELVKKVSEEMGVSQITANEFIDIFAKIVKEAVLEKGEEVTLPGFGTLMTIDRKERKGVNPKTGEIMTIKARKGFKFKPTASILEELKK